MAKSERLTCIHKHLFRVYREAAVNVLPDNGYDKSQMEQQEEQHFVTNHGAVTLALQ